MFRKPPDLVWVGIAVALGIWGILGGAVLTVIACGSFLSAQFLARPFARLPLTIAFSLAAALGAAVSFGSGETVDLIIWALLAVLGVYEVKSDFDAWQSRR
jgi:hypothetical protein